MTNFSNLNIESDFGLIVFCTLILIIAVQQIYISRNKGKTLSKPAKIIPAERNQIIDQLFTIDNTLLNCPFAICITEDNQIIWSNDRFAKVCQRKEINSLTSFDALLGTDMAKKMLKSGNKPYSFNIVCKNDINFDKWQRFTAVVWPIALDSSMILFIEQTQIVERKIVQSQFEYELITFLLQNCSNQHLNIIGNLKTIISQIRAPKETENIDLVEMVKKANSYYNSAFKKLKLHTITTLPHSAIVIHNPKDYELALRLIIEAVLNRINPEGQLGFAVYSQKRNTILELKIQGITLSPNEISHLFEFSAHQSPKEEQIMKWKLNLAIAQQIMLNYNSNIEVKSNPVSGTTISISCIGAKEQSLHR